MPLWRQDAFSHFVGMQQNATVQRNCKSFPHRGTASESGRYRNEKGMTSQENKGNEHHHSIMYKNWQVGCADALLDRRHLGGCLNQRFFPRAMGWITVIFSAICCGRIKLFIYYILPGRIVPLTACPFPYPSQILRNLINQSTSRCHWRLQINQGTSRCHWRLQTGRRHSQFAIAVHRFCRPLCASLCGLSRCFAETESLSMCIIIIMNDPCC